MYDYPASKDRHPVSSPLPISTDQPDMKSASSPSDGRPRSRRKHSLLDEILPLPTPARRPQSLTLARIARRTGAVAVLSIFLLSISFLALTSASSRTPHGLRALFGIAGQGDLGISQWVADELEPSGNGVNITSHKNVKIDFEQYKMLRTLDAKKFDITSAGKRLIFIGDVHGSFKPLQRLLKKLNYNEADDVIVHVGDLVAKGEKNIEVLEWMKSHEIFGVRGNHDQPVVEWRTWMEWAGGSNWEGYIDGFTTDEEDDALQALTAQNKVYPKHWKWKSQHWKIARQMSKDQYKYLVDLPLTLHIPSLHTFVVHAGILPHDPLKSISDPSQPLVAAAETDAVSSEAARLQEELSLMFDIPQNTDPWTLINMRSVYTKGKKKGKITKSQQKGTPWSEIWQSEMSRCVGKGSQSDEPDDNYTSEDSDESTLRKGKGKGKGKNDDLECYPVSVIYGHAAGRGLDIKDFSKGIDTGCVYGHSLTALVLGDISGLKGDVVSLGPHEGLLVSVKCEKGGI